MEYILLALLGVFFNVMDSVTTHIGLNKLPESIRAEEGNPIAKWGLERHPVLFEIAKQGFVVGYVCYGVYARDIGVLAVIAILFGIVVANNTIPLLMLVITKRKSKSPLFKLASVLGIPSWLTYPFICLILFGVTLWVIRIFI